MNHTRTFSAERQSVTAARRFATEILMGTADEVLDAVELMVSELATNCIRHVRTSFRLTIHRAASEIRIEVTDSGGGRPELRSPGPDDPSGRGLRIVDMLSARWGVSESESSGKTVWFTLAAPDEVSAKEERESEQSVAQLERPAEAGSSRSAGTVGVADPRSEVRGLSSRRLRSRCGPLGRRATPIS